LHETRVGTRWCGRSSAQPVNTFDLANGYIGEAVIARIDVLAFF
jgi:hypothetical protein